MTVAYNTAPLPPVSQPGFGALALARGDAPKAEATATAPIFLPTAPNLAFAVLTPNVGDFGTWATQMGATPLAGDFNGDGVGDVAMIGGGGWGTLPVAFGGRDKSFRVTNLPLDTFPQWANRVVRNR
jgi:hypothetical protein